MTNKNNFPFSNFLKIDELRNDTTDTEALSSIEEKTIEEENKATNSNLSSESELEILTDEIKNSIKELIPLDKYETYFSSNFRVSQITGTNVKILVTTMFYKKIIETHYIKYLQESFKKVMGKDFNISVEVIGQNESNAISVKTQVLKSQTSPIVQPQKVEINQSILGENNFSIPIDPEKTFNNFVVGPSNNLAFNGCMAVAEKPGVSYPSLYIYGSSGLGKTHLLHAIANKIRSEKPNQRINMISGNNFMIEMMNAYRLGNNNINDFRTKYTRMIDVLIVDDIHGLRGRDATQDEFFHVLTSLTNDKKQLIFTSDKKPNEIDGLPDRIKTRLSGGLVLDINQPDFETRIAILKAKAQEKDIYIPDDVAYLIANSIKSNIRELEGSLMKLGYYSSLNDVDIDLELAKRELRLNESNNLKNLTIEQIVKCVSGYYKVTITDIKSKSRLKDIVHARSVAMYLARKILSIPLVDIGKHFGGRDHSSALHLINKIEDERKNDSKLFQELNEIENELENYLST